MASSVVDRLVDAINGHDLDQAVRAHLDDPGVVAMPRLWFPARGRQAQRGH